MKVSRRILTRHVASQLAAGEDRTKVLDQLAAYIVYNRLHHDLELIVSDVFVQLARIGVVHANVTSARPLAQELIVSIRQYIEHHEGTKNIEIVEYVDHSLLGGVVIETPSKRFDASVRTRLKRLRNA